MIQSQIAHYYAVPTHTHTHTHTVWHIASSYMTYMCCVCVYVAPYATGAGEGCSQSLWRHDRCGHSKRSVGLGQLWRHLCRCGRLQYNGEAPWVCVWVCVCVGVCVCVCVCGWVGVRGVGHDHVCVAFADSAVAFPYFSLLRFQLPFWAIEHSRTRFFHMVT